MQKGKLIIMVIVLSLIANNAQGAMTDDLLFWTSMDNDWVDNISTVGMTTSGNPAFVAGVVNQAGDFDGDDYVWLQNTDYATMPEATVAYWFKTTDTANQFFNLGAAASAIFWTNRLYDSDGTSDSFDVSVYDQAGRKFRCWATESEPVNTGTWHHMIYIHNTSGSFIWINNTPQSLSCNAGAQNTYYPPDAMATASIDRLHLATRWYNGAAAATITAVIDEAGLWNRSLDAIERTALFAKTPYPFILDSTPPNVTLFYPVNETHYNDFNNSIHTNCTDVSGCDTCGINDSTWIAQGFGGKDWLFNKTVVANGNHSLQVWCTDTLGNNGSMDFWFVTDTVDPTITIDSPANNSWHNSNVLLNVSYYDTFLFRANTTITKAGTEKRYVTGVDIQTGTYISGNLTSIMYNDNLYYNFYEAGGVPATEVFFNITDIPELTQLDARIWYQGNPAHNAYLYIWNTSVWEQLVKINSGAWTTFNGSSWGSQYVTNSQVRLLINHTSNGVATHYFNVSNIVAETSSVYYNNYSGNLSGADTYYNITETVSVTNWADGEYQIFADVTDTHTTSYFDEELITYTTEHNDNLKTKHNDNLKTTYELSKGNVEFTYPKELNLQSHKLTDRITQLFINTVELDEIEIEIEADNIIYLTDSIYPCHLIINNAYWFDCVGLPTPTVTYSTGDKFIVKSFLDGKDFSLDSLGGLNNVNLTYLFFLDQTPPQFVFNTSTNTSTQVQLLFNSSEQVNVTWNFGRNCTATDSTGTEPLNNTFTLTEIGLTPSTDYWFNVTIVDIAGNDANSCFNINTSASPVVAPGCNCSQITTIVRNEIRRETMYIALGVIILGVISVLLFFAHSLDFFYFTDSKGKQIPIMKHLVILGGGWLLLAVANIAVHLSGLYDVTLLPSMTVFYKTVLYILITVTFFWFLGFMFEVFRMIGWAGNKPDTAEDDD